MKAWGSSLSQHSIFDARDVCVACGGETVCGETAARVCEGRGDGRGGGADGGWYGAFRRQGAGPVVPGAIPTTARSGLHLTAHATRVLSLGVCRLCVRVEGCGGRDELSVAVHGMPSDPPVAVRAMSNVLTVAVHEVAEFFHSQCMKWQMSFRLHAKKRAHGVVGSTGHVEFGATGVQRLEHRASARLGKAPARCPPNPPKAKSHFGLHCEKKIRHSGVCRSRDPGLRGLAVMFDVPSGSVKVGTGVGCRCTAGADAQDVSRVGLLHRGAGPLPHAPTAFATRCAGLTSHGAASRMRCSAFGTVCFVPTRAIRDVPY